MEEVTLVLAEDGVVDAAVLERGDRGLKVADVGEPVGACVVAQEDRLASECMEDGAHARAYQSGRGRAAQSGR